MRTESLLYSVRPTLIDKDIQNIWDNGGFTLTVRLSLYSTDHDVRFVATRNFRTPQ